MNESKIKYNIKINIEAEIELSNPYTKDELAYLVINTLIQKNIEDISTKIENISGFDNLSETSDYIIELKEEKKFLQSIINDKFNISIDKVKENHLKLIK